jgi:hypothetical protein
MKKFLLSTIALALFQIGFAQTTASVPVAPATEVSKPKLTKEEKALLKAKQEADLNEALKEAGLDEKQAATAKEILADASKKSNDLKANTALSETEKEDAKKLLNDDKNAKLKAIMGADKFKAYSTIRKNQKAAMGNTKAE